jgi:copper(I)-binding protein
MKRLIMLFSLIGILGATLFLSLNKSNEVYLLNVRATQIFGQTGMFMVALTIQNDGDAKTLVSVHSPSVDSITIINPGYEGSSIVIPAESIGILGADGVHIMLMMSAGDFDEGAFIPLSLVFEDYGIVTTRLLNAGSGMGGMNHGDAGGISVNPSPKIRLSAPNGFSESGSDITLEVDNFSFILTTDDAQHVPNEGHAHIYLNGLKLGRLYKTTFTLGAVPPNSYELRVELNSNDHKPYLSEAEPVGGFLLFTILNRL